MKWEKKNCETKFALIPHQCTVCGKWFWLERYTWKKDYWCRIEKEYCNECEKIPKKGDKL